MDNLIKDGVLKNKRLIGAFRAVDRKDFVPENLKEFAYIDEPLPIGGEQTISQPWTVAFMLELLGPKPGENIMEIGYGQEPGIKKIIDREESLKISNVIKDHNGIDRVMVLEWIN